MSVIRIVGRGLVYILMAPMLAVMVVTALLPLLIVLWLFGFLIIE